MYRSCMKVEPDSKVSLFSSNYVGFNRNNSIKLIKLLGFYGPFELESSNGLKYGNKQALLTFIQIPQIASLVSDRFQCMG